MHSTVAAKQNYKYDAVSSRYFQATQFLGQNIDFVLPLAQMKRLHNLPDFCPIAKADCDNNTSEVAVHLLAEKYENRIAVKGCLKATIPLVCQRCLTSVRYDTQVDFHWSPVESDEQVKSLPNNLEPIFTTKGAIDLYWQIEEQLLLSLPLVFKHETAMQCVQNATLQAISPP